MNGPVRAFPRQDTSSTGLRRSAADLGEVLALLSGGVRPDAETLSRLCASLRLLQGFLVAEAHQQAGREAIATFIDYSGTDPVPVAKFPHREVL
ncbi:hypothetical protein [Pseudorhodobacter sp.]|uniref:hypothetical protein n=1 Tax=Pseudorhodobacter sp. TaxID=1934400 RepID=UPI0026493BD2|nr:hypothetical protein [Pseudorhodobacter sp.]MDN5785712.1 hypothetical protein [Pseudorhodobacter sp.]